MSRIVFVNGTLVLPDRTVPGDDRFGHARHGSRFRSDGVESDR
jgi:hypothetical protein